MQKSHCVCMTRKKKSLCDIKTWSVSFSVWRTTTFSPLRHYLTQWYFISEEKASGKNHSVIGSTVDYITFLKQIWWKHGLFYPFFFLFTFILGILCCLFFKQSRSTEKEKIHFQPKNSASAMRTFNWTENETISCKLDSFLLRVKSNPNHHKMAPQLLQRYIFFF